MINQHAEIWVSGLVQGVYFRKYTQEMASGLTLVGTVQNLQDGRVYIQASGSDRNLKELFTWLWDGSPNSHVESIYVQKYREGFTEREDFRIMANAKEG